MGVMLRRIGSLIRIEGWGWRKSTTEVRSNAATAGPQCESAYDANPKPRELSKSRLGYRKHVTREDRELPPVEEDI